jgi:hypothetical protein
MGLVAAVLGAGCAGNPGPAGPSAVDEEKQVRGRFEELQAAVKASDADKVWGMLSSKSQADAEREARKVQTAYASAEEKTRQEQALGLTAAEVNALEGKGLLRSKPFQRKHHELPESTVEKVVVDTDTATVHFLEPDGDHEKMHLLREDGQWKVWLAMPKVEKP